MKPSRAQIAGALLLAALWRWLRQGIFSGCLAG
jgi:hypothetical protein